jgi:soluble lytic murein transglycosylase-like protein
MVAALRRLAKPIAKWLSVLAVAAACSPALADVWGYIDAQGVAHFATEKLDERYQLFFKTGESFSAGGGTATPASPNAKASSSAADGGRSQAKLLAFFDVSPGYKAVKHLIKDASVLHGIDYELLQALIAAESGYDTQAVSPKGAVGLMQLMPPTAERYGVKADKKTALAQKLTDPKTNIRAGSTYLRDLIKMFPGQLELAVAAYNAGEGAVQRAGNKIPNYPETKNYVKTVMQMYGYLKPPGAVVAARVGGRVRMEMMGGVGGAGGAGSGRSNMVPSLSPRSTAVSTATPLPGAVTAPSAAPLNPNTAPADFD